jgi:rod shape-determining protein MreC
MLVNHNNFQQAAVVNSSNYVIGSFYESVSGLTEYLDLRTTNEQLQKENALFRTGQITSFYDRGAVQNVRIDSNLEQQFTYLPAKVINNSINQRNNFLTLNRGKIHGIQKYMGVMCPEGVVGIVMNVEEHFCSVQSILNKNSKISAKIKENNTFGTLEWDGEDPYYANLININRQADVKVGQTILTSLHSKIFPENIAVGKIVKVGHDDGGNFYTVRVKLSTDFGSLDAVYIINNLMKAEIEKLEKNDSNLKAIPLDQTPNNK